MPVIPVPVFPIPVNLYFNQEPTSGAPDGQPDLYQDYRMSNQYTYDPGVLVLPVAGPDGTAPRIIKIHAAIGRRIAVMNAVKVDTPPILPRMGRNTKEGDVFVGGSLSLPLPQVNAQQTGFNYKASAQYEYVQPVTPRGYNDNDAFQTGCYPFPLILIDGLASGNPSQTVGVQGNPDVSTLRNDQNIPSPDGQGTKSPDWAWLSTTFVGNFFNDLL